jgi:uncharacterized integral membrane protein
MIRKLVTIALLVPLAILIVMFAVANRQVVTVTLDPFDSANPAFALTMPLFMLVLVLVGCGVVIGGAAAWLRQHKWRSRARRAETDNRVLRARLEERHATPALPARRPDASPVILPPAA